MKNLKSLIVALSAIQFLLSALDCNADGINYFSYQTGDWNSSESWTTDPSGTIYVNAENTYPKVGDNVIILNGRTIYATEPINVASIQLNIGGTLDLGDVTGNNLGTLRGQGILKLSTINFPSGIFTEFVDNNGGTVVYYNVSGTLAQNVYNNLEFQKTKNDALNNDITLASDLTVNGNFSLKRLNGSGKVNFTIGDNSTVRNIVVSKDIYIGNGAVLLPNATKAIHTLNIGGNFTNYGSAKFTNSTNANYKSDPTQGVVNVTFFGLSDNYLYCYGPTIFNKFTLDKGSDQTYILTVFSSDTENFKIFGKNISDASGNEAYRISQKSVYLKNGTLKLEGNIFIPSLSEGGMDFAIPLTSCLWLNGSNVKINLNESTSSGMALSLIGKFRLDAGEIDTKSSAGVVFRGTAQLEINGGKLRAGQFRPSNQVDVPLTAYKQTGGTVIVDNVFTNNAGSRENDKPTFCLPFSTNSFNMTGGTINITGATNRGAFLFAGDPGNGSITGGEINLIIKENNNSYNINSTIPFYNLNIRKEGASDKNVIVNSYNVKVASTNYFIQQNPLQVLNDLVIVGDDVKKLYPTLNANGANVIVGGDFIIQEGTTYTSTKNNNYSANTTIFNGINPQEFDVRGVADIGNLEIAENSDLGVNSSDIQIRKNLIIGENAILRDNGHKIYVAGNITNDGTHFRPVTGAGSIEMNGSTVQNIYGNGNGSFNNLTINYTATSGVVSNADMTITGDLRLASLPKALLKIGSTNVKFESNAHIYSSLTGTDQSFDNSRMIITSGSFSDAGVTKVFTENNSSFVYPFGINWKNTNYYMPQSIELTVAPEAYGKITSRPVNAIHPLAQNNKALNCYWKVTSEGFGGLKTDGVLLNYYYDYAKSNDFVGAGNEANYIPSALVYENQIPTWKPIENTSLINVADNKVTYTSDVPDGDYTAGDISAFQNLPILYSSENCNDGASHDWDDKGTWSKERVGGPSDMTLVPSEKTVVVIGDETHNHNVIINKNNKKAGNLQIAEGSVLDLSTYTGHNFGTIPDSKVIGTGTLRISCGKIDGTAVFPNGDFGLFLGENGGSVEYYTTGSINFNLPSSKTNYKHLIISPSSGQVITMPDVNLTTYGNYSINDLGTVYLNSKNPKSFLVNGNFDINAGTVQFRNVKKQTITLMGDLNISENATFNVRGEDDDELKEITNTIVDNTFNIYGDLSNNGILNMFDNGRYCNFNFVGNENKKIEGTGTNTFNKLNVDKGSDRNTILEVTADNLLLTEPLSLTNGTFRISNTKLDITLSQNASFTIPNTTCLSANKGTFRIATGDGNDYELLLNGRLEVLSDEGKTIVGSNNYNTNNDIEYFAAGVPEIIVNGGELIVNGQIRRSVKNASGSLSYRQSGGLVSILGKNNVLTRGMIEILNPGSRFNMSGGILSIAKAGGSTDVEDVQIRPETSNVTGGTIQFGTTTTNDKSFSYSASVPLWNISIGTKELSQQLTQRVLPTTLGGSLTINAGSIYNANGLALTLKGNFYNYNESAEIGIDKGGFIAGNDTQITAFEGVSQFINGTAGNVTNFANLKINPSNNVTLSASKAKIAVNNNLSIISKIFNDGGNVIELYGDAINDATHVSSIGGGIHFNNSSIRQIIRSDNSSNGNAGTFGNITINNPEVDMQNNMTINGILTLNGKLYIDDYKLIFGTSSSIPMPDGNFNASRMIALNGALSDHGVSKNFAAGSSSRFILPIGSGSKYTPAVYTISATSKPGTITVRPVSRLHPAVTDDEENELNYYWSVDSTGFGSNLRLSHEYYYLDEDVKPLVDDDDKYAVGFYQGWKSLWTNLTDGNSIADVDENRNVIKLNNVAFCRGDFTAGTAPNFGKINTFYSLKSGNWKNDTKDVWSLESHSGTPTILVPKGNPVKIAEGHTITITENKAYAASVSIDGILNCNSTIYHNLGSVNGSGKLRLEPTSKGMFVFPGGDFDEFMATPTTIIEFNGDIDATLPLKPGNTNKPFQNVIMSGNGIKYMTADNMKLYGYLRIEKGSVLSNDYDKNIVIEGDWIDENTEKDGFDPGRGNVIFNVKDAPLTESAQKVVLKRTENFFNFTISNHLGVSFTGDAGILISNRLYLTDGIINTGNNALSMSSTSSNVVTGGSANSFVDGLFRKNIANGSNFTFHVGNGNRYGKITLNNVSSATSPEYWGSQYFNTNPSPKYLTEEENKNVPLTSISDNEYWRVDRPDKTDKANVTLRWDDKSYPLVTGIASLRSHLRVIEYENAEKKWSERGASINSSAKTVGTTTQVSNDDYIFTLGLSGVTATIIDTPINPICNDGSQVSIPIVLTGTAPWTLTYKAVCGSTTKTFTQSGITSSKYNIVLRGSDLTDNSDETRTYTISLVSVTGNGESGICNVETTAKITVKKTFVPDIRGAFTVGGNEQRIYSTDNHSGSTYSWSWDGASGGSINNSAIYNPTVKTTTTTGTYMIKVKETSSEGCMMEKTVSIVVVDIPVPAFDPAPSSIVCVDTEYEYSTALISGHQYKWTINEGNKTTTYGWAENLNSKLITWKSPGSASVKIEERVGNTDVVGTVTHVLTVKPKLTAFNIVEKNAQTCQGGNASINLSGSESNVTYQLYNVGSNANVGSPMSGNGGPLAFSVSPNATATYAIRATNGGCSLDMNGDAMISVNPAPTISFNGFASTNPICERNAIVLKLEFTGAAPYSFEIIESSRGYSKSIASVDAISGAEMNYTLPDSPIWTPGTMPNVLTYSIKSLKDNSGCVNKSTITLPELKVYKIPETGSPYHLKNDVAK